MMAEIVDLPVRQRL